MMVLEGAVGAVARRLREQGLEVRTGWSGAARQKLTGTAVIVTVRGMEALPGAFAQYLGEGFDEVTGRWREIYGRRIALELGLDLYAPEEAGQEELAAALERLTQALSADCPAGLRLEKLSCGEVDWEKDQRALRQEVTARFGVWLEARTEDGAEFLDFELRGGWKS